MQVQVPDTLHSKLQLIPNFVMYKGKTQLTQFRVVNTEIQGRDTNTLRVTITLKRSCAYYITSVFLPSLCLIVAAEVTLFIHESHFEATIMVALTSTLVMYTLYNSISDNLPIDATFKMIDLWLLHGLLMPFVVFLVLVFSQLIGEKAGRMIQTQTRKQFLATSNALEKVTKRNTNTFLAVCKIVIPGFSTIFIVIFFFFSAAVYMSV